MGFRENLGAVKQNREGIRVSLPRVLRTHAGKKIFQ